MMTFYQVGKEAVNCTELGACHALTDAAVWIDLFEPTAEEEGAVGEEKVVGGGGHARRVLSGTHGIRKRNFGGQQELNVKRGQVGNGSQ